MTINLIIKALKENFYLQKEIKAFEFYKFMKSLMIFMRLKRILNKKGPNFK